jgi:hypothetical protein
MAGFFRQLEYISRAKFESSSGFLVEKGYEGGITREEARGRRSALFTV